MQTRWCDTPARTTRSAESRSRPVISPGRCRTVGSYDGGKPVAPARVPNSMPRRSSRLSLQPVQLILEFLHSVCESHEPVPLLRDHRSRCALREPGIGQLACRLRDFAFQPRHFFLNTRDLRSNVNLDLEHQMRWSNHCYWRLCIRKRINDAGLTEFRESLHIRKKRNQRVGIAHRQKWYTLRW